LPLFVQQLVKEEGTLFSVSFFMGMIKLYNQHSFNNDLR